MRFLLFSHRNWLKCLVLGVLTRPHFEEMRFITPFYAANTRFTGGLWASIGKCATSCLAKQTPGLGNLARFELSPSFQVVFVLDFRFLERTEQPFYAKPHLPNAVAK